MEALGTEELQAASPLAEPQGSAAAGAGNLAGWAGTRSLSLSPGMQIHDPKGSVQTTTQSG